MDWEPLGRMALAAALAVPVGLERELRGKPAGLRTHVVVATAAAAFALVSLLAAPAGDLGTDRTRIAAQIVSGIGFMGAGVIFASGGRVHGLTTAAALWSAAATGTCVGLREDGLAVALVVVTVVFLWPVDRLGTRLLWRINRDERNIHFSASGWDGLVAVQQELLRRGHRVSEFEYRRDGDVVTARVTVRSTEPEAQGLVEAMRALPGLLFVLPEATTDERGRTLD